MTHVCSNKSPLGKSHRIVSEASNLVIDANMIVAAEALKSVS